MQWPAKVHKSLREWHKKFLWFPCKIGSNVYWWIWVERKGEYCDPGVVGMEYWHWEYRNIETGKLLK